MWLRRTMTKQPKVVFNREHIERELQLRQRVLTCVLLAGKRRAGSAPNLCLGVRSLPVAHSSANTTRFGFPATFRSGPPYGLPQGFSGFPLFNGSPGNSYLVGNVRCSTWTIR